MRESLRMAATRDTTAFLRPPGTAGVISALCSGGEERSAVSKARNSATASSGRKGDVGAVTTSASALAYRAAMAESVISDRGRSRAPGHPGRSEEHTSELQSRQYLVCR